MAYKFVKQIDVGTDPMTGKRVRKRIYANSKTELDRKIKESVSEYAKNGSPSNMTFKEYKDKWYAANCANLALNTQSNYNTALNKTKHLDFTKMKNIIRTDLQKIVTDNAHHPYIARRVAVLLNSIWEAAVIDGVVEKNIAYKLKKPPKPQSNRRAFTQAELDALKKIDFTEDELLMVRILRQFGLRPGEAFALTLKDFNRAEKTLTICKSLTHNKENPVLKDTKTHVTRVLPVPDQFFDYLPKKKLYLFVNDDRTLLTKKQEWAFSRSILDKLNVALGGTNELKVTDAVLYTFRHTKATELYYTEGISLKAKAAYMGHSEEEFIRTYSHLMKEKEELEVLRKSVV